MFLRNRDSGGGIKNTVSRSTGDVLIGIAIEVIIALVSSKVIGWFENSGKKETPPILVADNVEIVDSDEEDDQD